MYLDFGPVSSHDENSNVVNRILAPKIYAHAKSQNVTLFGISVFVSVIREGSQNKIILDLRHALNPMTDVHMREKQREL